MALNLVRLLSGCESCLEPDHAQQAEPASWSRFEVLSVAVRISNLWIVVEAVSDTARKVVSTKSLPPQAGSDQLHPIRYTAPRLSKIR